MIYDNYNAVAVAGRQLKKSVTLFVPSLWGRSSYNVHCGFYWAQRISDPKKILIGEGNQYRYLLLEDLKTFPKAYAKN